MINGVSGAKGCQGLSGAKVAKTKDSGFKSRMQMVSGLNYTTVEESRGAEPNRIESGVIDKSRQVRSPLDSGRVLSDIFKNLETGQKKMDDILKISMSGVKLSQEELLALQVRVYKFTREVELISKLVEKGTSGMKQVVNTQI